MKAARKYLPGTTLRKNRLDCMTMRRPTAPDDSRSSQSGTARNFFSAVSTRGLGKNGAKKEPTFQRAQNDWLVPARLLVYCLLDGQAESRPRSVARG